MNLELIAISYSFIGLNVHRCWSSLLQSDHVVSTLHGTTYTPANVLVRRFLSRGSSSPTLAGTDAETRKQQVMTEVRSQLALANAQELINKMNEKWSVSRAPVHPRMG